MRISMQAYQQWYIVEYLDDGFAAVGLLSIGVQTS
jgi:hypothetical protein